MLNLIAKRWAKTRYRFNQLTEAATNDLNAGLALRQEAKKRDLAARLTKDADEMDARIKEVEEKLEKGFWECENGDEVSTDCGCSSPGTPAIVHISDCVFNHFNAEECPRHGCGKPMKLVSDAALW